MPSCPLAPKNSAQGVYTLFLPFKPIAMALDDRWGFAPHWGNDATQSKQSRGIRQVYTMENSREMVYFSRIPLSILMAQLTFTASLDRFDFNHWSYHIPVSDETAAQMMDENHRRVLVWIKESGPHHMALMKSKEYWYLLVNQELRTRLNLEGEKSFPVRIERDHSEFGHDVPEELQVLLDQDEEGNDYFRQLTPGKQRSLVYIVTTVKNPDSRMRKSLAILHHLKLAKGKLDFKQLNIWIKHYNNL